MSKVKVDWHTRSANIFRKDIVLDRFERYLKGLGLRNETIKLYLGRVGAFLDYAKSDLPSLETAKGYMAKLIDSKLSREHINNTCFGIKKFYKINDVDWDLIVLKINEGGPYYFDESDVLAIFRACSNIKHSAMLQTLFFGCLRSSEMCRLEEMQ